MSDDDETTHEMEEDAAQMDAGALMDVLGRSIGRGAGDDWAQVCLARLRAILESDAPAVREVRRCGDCPCCSVDETVTRELRYWCLLVLEETGSEAPPDWCPLRRGPVVLRLSEEVERGE